MLSISNISENKILNFLIILTITIFYIKIFHLYDHYPLLDEVIVLDRYLEWKNFLRKDHIGNHTINSFIGVILKSLFGYNFETLRFISFFCFILILLVFRLMFKKIYLYVFFLSLIIFSNILFNYMYIFRGYYVHAFLCAACFYFLKQYFLNGKHHINLKILLFLIFVQLSHSLLTIYIAIPILILILFDHFKKNEIKKNILNYFYFLILPVFFAFLVYTFLDGFIVLHSGNLNFTFLFENFFLIFFDCIKEGFSMIFFSSYTKTNFNALFDTINMIYSGYDDILVAEPIILFVYFLSLSFSIFNVLRSKKFVHLDYLILIIFTFFILTFKQPTLRVHIGPTFFCLFYIINCLDQYLSNIKILEIKSYYTSSIIICVLLIISVSPNKDFQQLKSHIVKIDKYKHDCELANKELNSSEKWVLINFYPHACKHRYDGEIQDNFLYK